MFSLV
jgi:hypothetical protein